MTYSFHISPAAENRFQRSSIVSILIVLVALLFALLAAGAIVIGGPVVGTALGLLLLGCVLFFFPRAAAWVVVVGGIGVVGLIELYLPSLQTVRWAFALLSVWLATVSVVNWLSRSKASEPWTPGTHSLALAMTIFVLTTLLAVVAGGMGAGNAIVGLKNYFQLWGLTLALAWLGYTPLDARRFMAFLGLIALVQLPFALQQFFVYVPERSSSAMAARNIVAVDIVAGTFGGARFGGGRSPDLAILICIAITLFFAQWKLGYRSLKATVFLSTLAFAPILLNEAKLALVLLPAGLFMLFRDTLVRRPLHATFGATLLTGVLALVVIAYTYLPGADDQRSKSVSDFIESSMSYNVGGKGYGSAVLNRTTVYSYWLDQHIKKGSILQAAVGHGPGFSNSSSIRSGDNPASARYSGYAIGLTGLSSLLWDVGILGASIFVVVLALAYRLAGQLITRWRGTVHEPVIETAKVSIVLLGLGLLHNDYVTFDFGYQTMLCLVLGYLFAMARPQPDGAQ